MIVLSFDPGVTTGWVLLCSDGSRVFYRDGGTVHGGWDAVHALLQTQLRDIQFAVPGARAALAVETVVGSAWARPGAKSAALIAASELAGRILGVGRERGMSVVEASAREWRRAIVGKANASDVLIKAVVHKRVRGVPRTNEHVRDAIGMGLYAAMKSRGTGQSNTQWGTT